MKMYVGRVVEDVDPSRSGVLYVHIDGWGDEETTYPVIFTTPAAGPLGGGLAAPVDKDALVLVGDADNSELLFYLGTIVTQRPRANPDAFTAGEKMTSTGLTSKEGAGLTITHEISDSDIKNITRLKGSGGSGEFVINNFPGNESVQMNAAGMNSNIKINGVYNNKPDQIEISAANSVTSRARKGSNMVTVGPYGGELKLINEGTQANPLRPLPIGLFNGDVKVTSENNQVVIESCTDPALIATDAAEGPGVIIKAGSVPNPLAEVRLDSQGNVNIKSGLNINLESTANINIKAVGQVNISGAQVNLQPVVPIPPIPPSKR